MFLGPSPRAHSVFSCISVSFFSTADWAGNLTAGDTPPHLTLHSYATGNGLILFPQIQNWGQGWVGPTTERVSNSQGIRPCYAGMASGSQTLCIEPMSNKEETLGTTQPFHLGSSTDVSLQSPSLTLNDSPASE